MPFTTPILADASNANNTGEYRGYSIRVKGDGRVEARQGDETYIVRNVLDAKYWIDQKEGGAPVEDVAPVLDSLDPATAVLGDPDVTMHIHGSGFTEASVISFAGQPEPIVFVSDAEITTVVKPSLPWGAVTLPVSVKNGVEESNVLDFTFTEAPLTRSRRTISMKHTNIKT